MSNNYAFVVILPNARRANVKSLSTNTTILQVLEDVCKKHGFKPEEFDLTHHNKVINLGNSIRFSGIPNNATLEMVASTKAREESEVKVGLQLEGGKRLMGSFSPQQTLWAVLEFWAEKGEPVYPKANEEGVEPVCIYMREEVAGQAQLETKTLRSLGLTKGSAIIRLIHRSQSQLKTQANVSTQRVYASTSTVSAPSPVVVKETEQQVPQTPPILHGSPTPTTPPPQQQKEEPMDISPTRNPKVKTGLVKEAEKLPEHKYQFMPPEIKNAQRFSKPGDLHILGPNDAILYHGDDVVVSKSEHDVDDSFFDLTINDVKRMYMDLKNTRENMEETPLQTQNARGLEKERNTLQMLHEYPTTIVRIRFSNRYILQGTFRTASTLQVLYDWLSSMLKDPKQNFHLFTAPPKKILERSFSLAEEGLVGMAVIYFGTDQEDHENMLKSEFYTKVSAPDAVYKFIHNKLKKQVGGGGENGEEDQQTSSSSTAGGSTSTQEQVLQTQRRAVQLQSPPKTNSPAPKWFKTQ